MLNIHRDGTYVEAIEHGGDGVEWDLDTGPVTISYQVLAHAIPHLPERQFVEDLATQGCMWGPPMRCSAREVDERCPTCRAKAIVAETES